MIKNFENGQINQHNELQEKSLKDRAHILLTIADTYLSAELIEEVEIIEELIKQGELEKAGKSLTEAEEQAEKIKEGRMKDISEHHQEKPLHVYVGYQIIKLRHKEHLTRDEFASRLGISKRELVKIEEGKKDITVDRLQEIAKALKSDLIDFVGLGNY